MTEPERDMETNREKRETNIATWIIAELRPEHQVTGKEARKTAKAILTIPGLAVLADGAPLANPYGTRAPARGVWNKAVAAMLNQGYRLIEVDGMNERGDNPAVRPLYDVDLFALCELFRAAKTAESHAGFAHVLSETSKATGVSEDRLRAEIVLRRDDAK